MTVLLVLSLLACAAWIARDIARRRHEDLHQSVDGFTRGLDALDPSVSGRRTR